MCLCECLSFCLSDYALYLFACAVVASIETMCSCPFQLHPHFVPVFLSQPLGRVHVEMLPTTIPYFVVSHPSYLFLLYPPSRSFLAWLVKTPTEKEQLRARQITTTQVCMRVYLCVPHVH